MRKLTIDNYYLLLKNNLLDPTSRWSNASKRSKRGSTCRARPFKGLDASKTKIYTFLRRAVRRRTPNNTTKQGCGNMQYCKVYKPLGAKFQMRAREANEVLPAGRVLLRG
ncbi:MAG: hypothetical protein J6C23_08510 [Clostridia bacterium]|nr:hypothetical protein [Clostridia bacterium]